MIRSKKSGQIKTEYQREYVHTNFDVDFDFAGPTLNGALVAGYNGWLLGYQMGFDTAKSKLARSNFAIGYATDEFVLHTNVSVLKITLKAKLRNNPLVA